MSHSDRLLKTPQTFRRLIGEVAVAEAQALEARPKLQPIFGAFSGGGQTTFSVMPTARAASSG